VQTIQQLIVTRDYVGQRLDNYLFSRLKGLPKSLLYRNIRKGGIRVNKKRKKPDYRLQEGDLIRIPPLQQSEPRKKNSPNKKLLDFFEKRILFEDKNFLAINKPTGIAVHGGSGIKLGIIEILRSRPKQKYLELVHRLDRDTSGCLLIAKKRRILIEMQQLLKGGAIKKIYLALVCSHWPDSVKQIDMPLVKNRLQSGERIVRTHKQAGKLCLTEFRPLQYFTDATLVEAIPITGRTHQIRVHAQYAGHPIIGDVKYGDKTINKKMRALGCKRLFLHANELIFSLPSTQQNFRINAELPSELINVLNKLTKTSTLPSEL
jgi:23S rRNA pseudouridine955/2504/2580 synthase